MKEKGFFMIIFFLLLIVWMIDYIPIWGFQGGIILSFLTMLFGLPLILINSEILYPEFIEKQESSDLINLNTALYVFSVLCLALIGSFCFSYLIRIDEIENITKIYEHTVSKNWFSIRNFPEFLIIIFLFHLALRTKNSLNRKQLNDYLRYLSFENHLHNIDKLVVNAVTNPEKSTDIYSTLQEYIAYALPENKKHNLVEIEKEIYKMNDFILFLKFGEFENIKELNTYSSEPEENNTDKIWLNNGLLKHKEKFANKKIEKLIFFDLVYNSIKFANACENRIRRVRIKLEIDDDEWLYFQIMNTKPTVEEVTNKKIITHGIGKKNLEKRLNYLYPGRHTIEVDDKKEVENCLWYEVRIKLFLGFDRKEDFIYFN